MGSRTAEDDDLWDFSTPAGAVALSESSGSDSDFDAKPVKPLPKSRRKKFDERTVEVNDLVVLDASSDEDDSDLDIVAEVKRMKAKESRKDALDDLDFIVISEPVSRQPTAEDEAEKAILASRMSELEQLRRALKRPYQLEEEEVEKTAEDETGAEDANNNHGETQNGEGDSSAQEETQAPEAEKVIIKLQSKLNEPPLKLRIGKVVPLERLFGAFRKQGLVKEWFDEETVLRFIFDGEVVDPQQTAEDLDIDDDCVIEVHW